ncbi:GMC family oxidoreductase [Streptomyces sp. NBC_01497]|uniref:GMC family oxidoreductase n=1 Tax=Streptomyces sp. NBC_01497 TaxID=2903885 RepID=UPI002E37E9F1|nr:GMC family oxidoreductase N-terminal domain-containing protein [Streptomyces sp. NBC_01497]
MAGYDYVVVGAGTAGCVLAARLSEDPAARVLLLEAGGASVPEAVSVPSVWLSLQGTAVDWADVSAVQASTCDTVPLPRGRTLGGSSAINAMVFTRGHRSSYDAWTAGGAEGWGYDDLLPYLRRTESAPGRDPALRGTSGPLTVAPAPERHPLAAAGLRAAYEVGAPAADDINSGEEEGFGWADLNIVDGRRQSAADAYLIPVIGRSNLDVVTGALAHRVRVEGGRCTGVTFSLGDEIHTADCDGEVVLCAGTAGSAHLLMLSGIGPADHLRTRGVEVVLDLPGVGANLHDHPRSTVVVGSPRPVPPGVNNHAEVIGLIASALSPGTPDLQFQVLDVPYHSPGLPPSLPVPGQAYSVAFGAMTPRSRGSLRLRDGEPGGRIRFDPNYYGDPHDVATMAEGLRIAREIAGADALAPWRAAEVLPGPDRDLGDVDAVRTYLYNSLRTYSHHVGTCRMGTAGEAVVDPELRVRGVERLRVADASVMPSVVSANPNATVYAIAERAADLLDGRGGGRMA